MNFKRLYKKTSTGSIQYWEIETIKNKIITRYGKVDGKEQTTEDIIQEGKNLDRSNQTTPIEQAEFEAKSQWEKKIKKGYTENINKANDGQDNLNGGVFPMLAQQFSKHGSKIIYPAYIQPKLDGLRCLTDENLDMWSRTRKPINSLPHIREELNKFKDLSGKFLDGELYNHEAKFEELSHFIRSEGAVSGCEIIEYHIYDVVMEGTFQERTEWLQKNFPKDCKYLKMVTTTPVDDEESALESFTNYLEGGYEGAIIRNSNGLYVNKRSYDLQKIKEFEDAEFEIIGVKEGRGKLSGHAGSFTCKTSNGDVFDAKLKGDLCRLKDYYNNQEMCIGKMLTVQFQGYTNKNGVPRFPVGLRIREPE